jgi:hypothetical protein
MEQQLVESSFHWSSSVECVLIPQDGIERIWPMAASFLEKATNRTKKIDLDSLRECADKGLMQIWIAYDPEEDEILSAAATEIVDYVSGLKSARIMLLGGLELNRWREAIDTIEQWASDQGCSLIEIVGRRGWGRVYPEYVEIETWFAKEIG